MTLALCDIRRDLLFFLLKKEKKLTEQPIKDSVLSFRLKKITFAYGPIKKRAEWMLAVLQVWIVKEFLTRNYYYRGGIVGVGGLIGNRRKNIESCLTPYALPPPTALHRNSHFQTKRGLTAMIWLIYMWIMKQPSRFCEFTPSELLF